MKILSAIAGVTAFFVLAFSLLFGYGYYLSWDVKRWDKKIDALCAANGGADVATRVYETAVAPESEEYFVDLKPVRAFRIPERSKGELLGRQYPYVMETRVVEVLNDRDPSVVKYTARIVRVSDNKMLAERFGYQRAGGGIQLWDPDEIRTCPRDLTEDRLEVRVFTNHPKHQFLEKK